MKFLFIGLGGIGQRHLRNLRTLCGSSCEIIAYRVRREGGVLNDQLQLEAAEGLEARYSIRSFDSLDAALAQRPLAAFICNPTSLHMSSALAAAQAKCHLFIEKPLGTSLEGVQQLAAAVHEHRLVCMVAYQLRFHPCLRLAHELFSSGAIGRAVASRATVGEYLPGWHRYEDYRRMYAARRALGGGVVLSQIHELDYLYWFFGRPQRVMAMGGHLSDLDIDVEDVASTLLDYGNMVAHLHQDYLQQPPTRSFEIIGSAGRLCVDLRAATVQAYDAAGELLLIRAFPELVRNTLFLDQLRCFLAAVQHGGAVPADLETGSQSLEMALAIRRSLEMRVPIDLRRTP